MSYDSRFPVLKYPEPDKLPAPGTFLFAAFILSTFFILQLTGCAASLKQAKTPATKKPETITVWESETPPPGWILDGSKLADKKEEYEYFIGVSGKFSEEKGVRDDAFVNAVKNAVRYIGIDMKIDWKQVIRVDQKGAEIISPEIKGVEKESSLAEAFIRGIKPFKSLASKFGSNCQI